MLRLTHLPPSQGATINTRCTKLIMNDNSPGASMSLPRYDRRGEEPQSDNLDDLIVPDQLEAKLAQSSLSLGGRGLVRALVRTSSPRLFPGGGIGIEYGALLKSAARPDLLATHISEARTHLLAANVDLLFVPGMSGYPIGAMYSQASGIPALLLKKQSFSADIPADHPPGAFLIPSYTSAGDTLISADPLAARDILATIIDRQLAAGKSDQELAIAIRIAGADEIIDKATMATAITETAPVFCRSVVQSLLAQRADQIAGRPVEFDIRVVAWVTPIVKAYNRAAEMLQARFGITPFAGIALTGLHLDPPAIGIAGLGTVSMKPAGAID